jgi:hypothetical protein
MGDSGNRIASWTLRELKDRRVNPTVVKACKRDAPIAHHWRQKSWENNLDCGLGAGVQVFASSSRLEETAV